MTIHGTVNVYSQKHEVGVSSVSSLLVLSVTGVMLKVGLKKRKKSLSLVYRYSHKDRKLAKFAKTIFADDKKVFEKMSLEFTCSQGSKGWRMCAFIFKKGIIMWRFLPSAKKYGFTNGKVTATMPR